MEKDKHIIPLEVVCNVQFLSIKWELNTLFVCHFFLLRKKMRIYDIFFVGICTLHMDNQEVEIIEDFLEFHNLTHIEFSYVECTRDWLEVLKVLKHCSKLQNLVNDPGLLEFNSINDFFFFFCILLILRHTYCLTIGSRL